MENGYFATTTRLIIQRFPHIHIINILASGKCYRQRKNLPYPKFLKR